MISGNLGGIGLAGDNGNLVEGNYIGTDPTGTIAIGNEGYGDVDLVQGASNDTIGGTTAGTGNIISGDDFPRGGWGVGIDMATDCVVEGNYIGTDMTGTKALPNFNGIDFGQAINSNDTIGGATATPGREPATSSRAMETALISSENPASLLSKATRLARSPCQGVGRHPATVTTASTSFPRPARS